MLSIVVITEKVKNAHLPNLSSLINQNTTSHTIPHSTYYSVMTQPSIAIVYIHTMASRIPRTILSLRATLPRVQVIPSRTFATLPTATATRPTLRVTTPFVGRFKSTERSVWAKEPIISYEELKPITQQPNDVRIPLQSPVSLQHYLESGKQE